MDKWERQPIRVGMVLGFVLVPLLGILQEYALRRFTGYKALSRFELLDYFFPGAIFGAILGANALQAFVYHRQGDYYRARWQLICSGGFILLLWLFLLYPVWSSQHQGTVLILGVRAPGLIGLFFNADFAKNLSLHCALLMLVLGFLMRSER